MCTAINGDKSSEGVMWAANHSRVQSDPDANPPSPLSQASLDLGLYLSASPGCTGKCATPVGVQKGVDSFMRLGKLKRPAEGKGRARSAQPFGKVLRSLTFSLTGITYKNPLVPGRDL
ncbi:hypothetical protein RRF57_006831 [Xylaria bambusicola]|uniref:Uncharacterized protein n=1 Tax=Xylaria bambusicola TaxID=326684 RepID=A0AAN7ZA24_9PEZI